MRDIAIIRESKKENQTTAATILKGGKTVRLKNDNELLYVTGSAAFWMAIGAGLIYSGDNGGIVYIGFGVFLLWLEMVGEKHYADKLERELNAELRRRERDRR